MPLSCCRFIAAYNRCAFGFRAALPELVLIYGPSPITTQARHYATRGSIMTAALPFGYGLSALLIHLVSPNNKKNRPKAVCVSLADLVFLSLSVQKTSDLA